VSTQEQWEALASTVGLSVGDLRSRTPRLRALASRLTSEWLDDVAKREIATELGEIAAAIDRVRRALTARADALVADTQVIDVSKL
jgi:hypothetical protein